MVRLIFLFYNPSPPGCQLVLILFAMAGNLTAIFPLEDLSFPGLADVSYVKLLATLAAFPVVAIVLNVLSQRVCAFHPGGIYLTYHLLVPASRQESPSGRFPLGAHCGLRCRVRN